MVFLKHRFCLITAYWVDRLGPGCEGELGYLTPGEGILSLGWGRTKRDQGDGERVF